MVDALEADAAFGKFANDDFNEGEHLVFVVGGELDFVFLEDDFRLGVLEVKSGDDFLLGLVHGVFDFHRVDGGYDVE